MSFGDLDFFFYHKQSLDANMFTFNRTCLLLKECAKVDALGIEINSNAATTIRLSSRLSTTSCAGSSIVANSVTKSIHHIRTPY